MDPISIGLGVVGLGMSIFGGLSQSNVAKKEAQVSQNITGVEEQQDKVRQQAMMLSGRRNQLEVLRNSQRARAMAVQAGANSGANLGSSGIQGGIAETENEGNYGLLGINQNLQSGNTMFGLNSQINQYRGQLASLQSQASTDQGIASLGGSIMKAGPMIGSMFGGGNGLNFGNTFQNMTKGFTSFLH